MTENKPVKAELVYAQFVTLYSYDQESDICSICKSPLTYPCTECFNNKRDKCNIALGKCNHSYHYHCISKWLTTESKCPIDGTIFNYKFQTLDDPKWKEDLIKNNNRAKLQKKINF